MDAEVGVGCRRLGFLRKLSRPAMKENGEVFQDGDKTRVGWVEREALSRVEEREIVEH